MVTYVALLRGINVGKNNQIAMADLRELLSGLGFTDVATLLRSGNAVFTTGERTPAEIAAEIEGAITERLGLRIRCLVRTAAELRAVIDADPMRGKEINGSRYLALFLDHPIDQNLLARHDPRELDTGNVFLGDRVVYQWCPDGIMAAPGVTAFVEKKLDVVVSNRNWNTVTKLAAMLEG
ncbi:uncharacterized protein (DUF1697 family) [Herbihabitans rhizosphaerae]|uniref:Uncharacterized protein (DUF1697 family) n=1 Tax=Herbihabitans rhizosphaerae TaxID=1872711 RepID=A0A4Q7KFU8_9PSEU|nr:DUF1697 domain-containing protein [Herbihabitans rhizosphaerae]RZS32773.1 uncharacterized protein (DUF1697 family) [Herbihabitans rhizosphaerae]